MAASGELTTYPAGAAQAREPGWQEDAGARSGRARHEHTEERTMKCRYLDEGKAPVCRASSYTYQPSEFEYTNFCSVDRHQMCLFYCKRRAAEDAGELASPGKGPEASLKNDGHS